MLFKLSPKYSLQLFYPQISICSDTKKLSSNYHITKATKEYQLWLIREAFKVKNKPILETIERIVRGTRKKTRYLWTLAIMGGRVIVQDQYIKFKILWSQG